VLEIETARITLLFTPNACIEYPERLMLDPEMTVARFREMTEISPEVAKLFAIAVPDFDKPVDIANIRCAPIGFQHLIGLLDLSVTYIQLGLKFGWRYPETYLHPRYQGNLADVMIVLSRPLEKKHGEQK